MLDYLFRPGYGASIQMLKLEIGGNANSSDGSEPSVEQVRGRLGCNVGYEFWLAHQALIRNPAIKLYGLQWSAPAWVRSRSNTLWTAADISYLLDWLGCARKAGLRISYLGGWNEHYTPGSATIAHWYVALRRALDRRGYSSVKIVASDAPGFTNPRVWAVAADMAGRPAFRRSVAVIGVHDVCGAESHGIRCTASPQALGLARSDHKPLWQSEFGHTPTSGAGSHEEGPAGLARTLVNEYVNADITGVLLWPLVDAMPPGLPFSNRGLLVADQPWSGFYRVSELTWITAQTTQFTEPGWRFVKGADGALSGGGSYVSYESPSHHDWSLVVQTTTALRSQQIVVHPTGGLAGVASLWMTRLDGRRQFVDLGPVASHRGSFTVTLQPGAVYTLSSWGGQSKAGGVSASVPKPTRMPLPYYAGPDGAGMARYLAPMEGSFQYVNGDLTQTTLGAPVPWISCDATFPYAVVGDTHWTSYRVSTTVAFPASAPRSRPPSAMLVARFSGFREPCEFDGYELVLDAAGSWRIVRNGATPRQLAAGSVSASRDFSMSLTVRGATISAFVDGRRVASVTDRAYRTGLAGVGSLGFDEVRYLSLTVS